MTTIALVGGAQTTRGAVQYSQADEIWAANWSYEYDWLVEKHEISRLFEMHPVWLYAETDKEAWNKPHKHWMWLKEPHPMPIYMLRQDPDVPACIRYPIEDVTQDLFKNLKRVEWGPSNSVPGQRDNERPPEIPSTAFFTSSFDYMLALAIHMKDEWSIDTIETFGMEMGSDTEYRYQKPGANFFIGMALERGIKIKIPQSSVIVKSKMYGYEGAQMIFRTDLERYLIKYNDMRREHTAKMNHLEGQYSVLEQNLRDIVAELGIEHDEAKAAAKQLRELGFQIQDLRDMTSIAAGAFQATKTFIDEVDLEEPEGALNNIWGNKVEWQNTAA